MRLRPAPLIGVALVAVLCAARLAIAQEGIRGHAAGRSVLFFTHAAGREPDVIDRKGQALSHAELWLTKASRGRFDLICSQDPAELSDPLRYAAIVFYTSGELPISDFHKTTLVECVRDGVGFAGIHGAADALGGFAPYVEMLGGSFDGQPWIQESTVRVEDRKHPSSGPFGERFVIEDEICRFKDWSRERVRVLLSLDPSSIDPAKDAREDNDYALAWCREFGRGRVFYTALGHRAGTWSDPRFLIHLVNGIESTIRMPTGWVCGTAVRQEESRRVRLSEGDALGSWRHADGSDARWHAAGGILEVVPGSGDLVTRQSFGDAYLEISFQTPAMPGTEGPERGNSGIYLQGRYEIQVLDSFGRPPGAQECGAIYGKKAADLPACLEAGVWQHYQISFAAPRFGPDGTKTKNARVTVLLNGLRIHDEVEIDGPTSGGAPEGPEPGPLRLQDHGSALRFANISVLPARSRS